MRNVYRVTAKHRCAYCHKLTNRREGIVGFPICTKCAKRNKK